MGTKWHEVFGNTNEHLMTNSNWLMSHSSANLRLCRRIRLQRPEKQDFFRTDLNN